MRQSVDACRLEILAKAGDALARASRSRARRRRAAIVAMLAILVSPLAIRAVWRGESMDHRAPTVVRDATRAPTLDFARVETADITRSVDFAVVDVPGRIELEILEDSDFEQALVEAGHCVKILRVRDTVRLVDCGTGRPARVESALAYNKG